MGTLPVSVTTSSTPLKTAEYMATGHALKKRKMSPSVLAVMVVVKVCTTVRGAAGVTDEVLYLKERAMSESVEKALLQQSGCTCEKCQELRAKYNIAPPVPGSTQVH